MLQEITQMKAKVFNEEKLIREKMKTMARLHDTKVLFFNPDDDHLALRIHCR